MKKLEKNITLKLISCTLLTLILSGCSNETSDSHSGDDMENKSDQDSALLKNVDTTSSAVPAACGNRGLAIGDTVAVTDSQNVHSDADLNSPKVKNEKASEILGTEHYHQIDNSTTVRRLCVQNEWTEVQIVTPSWLTHVRGWVPSTVLREIEHNENGSRIYVEEDFSWYENTAPYKQQITATINKISIENQNCSQLDTASVSQSPSRSTLEDPVFFVSCGSGTEAFNVWFRPNDAEAGTVFEAREPLEMNAAVNACEIAAQQSAINPSTVSFSRIWDMAYIPHVSGRSRVVSTFTAKNAFNLELEYRIDCLFDGPALIETNIAQKNS